MSAMLAFVISAFALTACSGNNNDGQVSQQSSTVSITSEQNAQLNSLIGSFFNKSSSDETSLVVSYEESSYAQPSYTQPSYDPYDYDDDDDDYDYPYGQNSVVQPSYVQPSTTVPQYSQTVPSSGTSIKAALEADIGLDQVVQLYGQQMAGSNMTVYGEYASDDKIVLYMQLTQYVDPSQSAVASAVSQLETQFSSLQPQFSSSIKNMETQYNVRPFEMEFRFCNGDGSLLYSRVFGDSY